MPRRRTFGTVRRLPSGRHQVRYLAPDGSRRLAPMTFADKTSAARWLSLCQADIARGTWRDDAGLLEPLKEYSARWLVERPNLADRTIAYYEGLLRLHIVPHLGDRRLGELSPARVRSWHRQLVDSGLGQSTIAKAYRLLRTILGTAVDDGLLDRNPCRLRGAATEHPAERPVLTLDDVSRLANAIDPRYALFVWLAVLGSLRWGELMGLRVTDLNEAASTIRIARSVAEIGTRQFIKTPKTAAGVRIVTLPASLWPQINEHIEVFSEQVEPLRLFVGPLGGTPRRPNFSKIWARALRGAGLQGIHIHDLRHTGNHLAAITGASTRELMGRMGHASWEAALLYQHRTTERDAAIAQELDKMLADRNLESPSIRSKRRPLPEI